MQQLMAYEEEKDIQQLMAYEEENFTKRKNLTA